MYNKIQNYKLIKDCGKGAYGKVYIAENSISKQIVALKVIHGKHESRELSGLIKYREIHHPNLLQIYHVDRTETGELYYTMELADNIGKSIEDYTPDTLGNRLDRQQRIAPDKLKEIVSELLNGIEKLHSSRLIHRDIKPDNILFINGRPVLADIGLATNITLAEPIGTPQFMPQNRPNADFFSDLYAMGMVTYCALTGLLPSDYPRIPSNLNNAKELINLCNTVCSRTISLDKFRALITSKKSSKIKIKYLIWLAPLTLVLFFIYYAVSLKIPTSIPHSNISSIEKITLSEFSKKVQTLKEEYKISPTLEKEIRLYYKEQEKKNKKLFMTAAQSTNKQDMPKHFEYLRDLKERDIFYAFGGKLSHLDFTIKNSESLPNIYAIEDIKKLLIEIKNQEDKIQKEWNIQQKRI